MDRSRLARRSLVLASLLALAGCRDRDVLAVAGDTEVRKAELDAYLSRRGGAATGDAQGALVELGQRALLAEAARKEGLDDDPVIAARLAQARREILAQAYLDRELASAGREDVLRSKYAAEKEALARRRVHVAHIVFRVREGQPGAREAALSRATRAYARLAAGEPFEKVAKESSEDPATGAKGGDLGALLEGEVDAAFFEAAAALARGEFSRPIELPYGFHVIKALEPVERVTPSFEEVKGVLAAQARGEAEARLLERVKKEISVKTYPERLPEPKRPRAAKTGEGS